MITAHPDTKLYYLCRAVVSLKAGERIEIDRFDLRDVEQFTHNDALFTVPDRILGNIVGSAYEFSFRADPRTGNVVFSRHKNDGTVHYREPDEAYRIARLRRETA